MSLLKPGIYRHYKGKEYQIYEVARHSESEEHLVVYRCLYGDYSLWVRPLAMFTENIINADGNAEPRFKWVRPVGNENNSSTSQPDGFV